MTQQTWKYTFVVDRHKQEQESKSRVERLHINAESQMIDISFCTFVLFFCTIVELIIDKISRQDQHNYDKYRTKIIAVYTSPFQYTASL